MSGEQKPRQLSVKAVVINGVVLAVAIGVAISTLWPVYQGTAFIIAAGGGTLLGLTIATLGARWRASALIVMLATIAGYLVFGVPLAVPSGAIFGVLPSITGLTDLLSGAALSWKQLLTIVTPVGSYQALLVPVFILTLLAAVVGMTIALRAKYGELAVLAPIVLFVAAILLGPTTAFAPIETALVLAILLVFWAMWMQRTRRAAAVAKLAQRAPHLQESALTRRITRTRTVLTAAVILALAVAGGAAASVALPASAPRDVLRRHAEQPFDPRDYPSPLSAFRSYLLPDQVDRTLMTVSGLPADGHIRLASLDTYDGIVYSVGSAEVTSASGSFTRLPYRLDQSGVPGDEVRISVTIDGYRGVWVPGVGKLASIRFASDDAAKLTDAFYYNDLGATGAIVGGLSNGDAYSSTAIVPEAIDDLGSLRPGTAVLPPILVEPDGLRDALAAWVNVDDSPGDQLAEMIAGMRRDGYVSHGLSPDEPPSRSGHAADRITQLVTDQPMLGDGEQYAVAAALMARLIGFPARVVVGFVPAVSGTGAAVAVTGSDIAAWIEVQDSSGVWRSVDPNPEVRPVPDKEPEKPTVVSRPQVVVPPPPEDPRQQEDPAVPQKVPEDDKQAGDPVIAALLFAATIAGWVVLGAAIILGPFLAVIVAKMRRRRLRRRARSAVGRIEGGWREFSDIALDRGFELPLTGTRAETAGVVGGMRPLVLATAVDRAVFAPGEPSEEDVTRVWQEVDGLQESLDTPLSTFQRWRAAVSLRSLRRGGRRAGRRR